MKSTVLSTSTLGYKDRFEVILGSTISIVDVIRITITIQDFLFILGGE